VLLRLRGLVGPERISLNYLLCFDLSLDFPALALAPRYGLHRSLEWTDIGAVRPTQGDFGL
jgi:hypothetical protein